MQNFASIPFSTDLATLAEMYQMYKRIMRHWQEVLPSNSMHEFAYEQTVEDPESSIRGLHEFCELPYNEDWPGFWRYARRVDTASQWQVRRPIYQSSLQRWVRYREFLGPLLELDTE